MIPEAKYYECHVTVEPVFGEELAILTNLAYEFYFKPAKLLMQRSREETPERSDKDTFCTATNKDFDTLQCDMRMFVRSIRSHGFKVWRTKIEAVLFDERFKE